MRCLSGEASARLVDKYKNMGFIQKQYSKLCDYFQWCAVYSFDDKDEERLERAIDVLIKENIELKKHLCK